MHAQDDVNLQVLPMFQGTFAISAALIYPDKDMHSSLSKMCMVQI